MKMPEEIKKALKACNKEPISLRNCAAECPYHVGTYSCLWDLRKDSLALIEQLEAQIARQENLIVDVLKEMAE